MQTFYFRPFPDVSGLGRLLLGVGPLLVAPVESVAVELVRGVRPTTVLNPVTTGLHICNENVLTLLSNVNLVFPKQPPSWQANSESDWQ